MTFPIKSFMTFFTKLFPVIVDTQIVPAYISPIKVSFHSFWKRLHTTLLTFRSFSKSSRDPVMNRSVRWAFLPKIMSFVSIENIEAFFRTELSIVSDGIRNLLLTDQTIYSTTFPSSKERTWFRAKYISSLKSPSLEGKSFPTRFTKYGFLFSSTKTLALSRAKSSFTVNDPFIFLSAGSAY